MTTVKIARWGGQHILYMPLHIADRLGLFEKLGLDVTIYNAGNDNDIYAEVVRGRAHFGVGDPTFVALGQQQGHDTRVVATIVGNANLFGLTHHTEIKPFTQISDFVGLRVGTYPKPSTSYTFLSALKARQPRLLKSMQIVETEIGQQAYLLASDRVDMILECEPMVSNAAHQGLNIVCSMCDFFPEFLLTGLMTSQAVIAASPETVAKVVRAIQQALTICRREPEKVVSVATELFPATSRTILDEAVHRLIATNAWPEQAIVSPQAWANALKLRQDVGELTQQPAFESVVDQRFAFAAREERNL